MTSPARALTRTALAAVAAAACAAGPLTPASQAAAVELPPVGAVLDYQLGSAYTPPGGVNLVTRDSTASPAPGIYSICYVNGFQSQPGDRDVWLNQRGHLVLKDSSGRPITDPNWPDELLFDTSTAAKRTELASIIGATIDRCAAKGFKAVEVDNLDSYLRSRGKLSVNNNLAYAKLLADRAHGKNLAIGQKNSAEQASRGRTEVGFDFAVSEECHRWEECSSYSDVYGSHVMDIEYTDDLRGTFEDVCDDPDTPATTTLRDRYLVGPDDSGYAFDHC
ncbi:endo alpha-1,4 polygalactosaminidase [Lentzea sp. DG1S-22]|uniref:endo alpha-1,4 polygalactosaminidase n=1 Tax=Lentzea sp. DG1S-22 TaxID=3108822 RepID=UPI002E78439A|nr:endo alpha-1,4 polygalactosaminidase [Lentzea sp. DG1S-22]WVH83737.1 endo alpha-1,4 polygalactosaminidase [Lentzea sp. DG1S-22]